MVLPETPQELDVPRALDLLRAFEAGRVAIVQPPHWIAEVAAVVVRLRPEFASQAVGYLCALEVPVSEDLDIYLTAVRLARESRQHVFDTLYHATALHTPGALLVTADGRYHRGARTRRGMAMLRAVDPSNL
jgi:predicted nucleic acid-binding protein